MKLLYLTNIQIPSSSAQSLQVQAMSRVFWERLKDDFVLISPKNKKNRNLEKEYNWIKLNVLNFLPRTLRYFLLFLKSLPYVLKFEPDFIFSRDIGIVFLYKILGFRTVYEIHKLFETKLGNLFFRFISPKIKIISISEALRQHIINQYNLEEKNILVSHDGVFLEEFEKIKLTKRELKRRFLNLKEEDFVVLYAGTLQQGKGVDLILKAASSLKDIFFLIIGGEETEIEGIRKEVSNNVIFFKRKSHQEVPFFLKAADLLILPLTKNLRYWRYSSPLKLFEYMASGTPILASNIGSISEVLNEKNSFLFDPENLNDLIDKIKFAQDNWQEREKRADNAFRDVKNYTWQKRVSKILNFLQNDKQ